MCLLSVSAEGVKHSTLCCFLFQTSNLTMVARLLSYSVSISKCCFCNTLPHASTPPPIASLLRSPPKPPTPRSTMTPRPSERRRPSSGPCCRAPWGPWAPAGGPASRWTPGTTTTPKIWRTRRRKDFCPRGRSCWRDSRRSNKSSCVHTHRPPRSVSTQSALWTGREPPLSDCVRYINQWYSCFGGGYESTTWCTVQCQNQEREVACRHKKTYYCDVF